MSIYLNSFHVISENTQGRKAAYEYGFHSFIDGSIRREPDFENEYPSITALCRQGAFAPKLRTKDIIVYISLPGTVKELRGAYYLVAILKVYKTFETHQKAANWYQENDLSLPSNCLVSNNQSLELEQSRGPNRELTREFGDNLQVLKKVWDGSYRKTSKQYPIFHACCDIYNSVKQNVRPNQIFRSDFENILGRRVPVTQMPNNLNEIQLQKFIEISRR